MILKNIKTAIFLMVLFLFSNQFLAQKKVFNGNPDTAFKTARELAFNGKRAQAQDSLRFILTSYPNYLDIRAFLASTYSWDGSYAKARKEFKYVLDKDKERKTDWIAYIKNEQYAEKYYKALEQSQKALKIFPNDPDLLQLKAKSQLNSGNREDALRTIKGALISHPENEELNNYKKSLEGDINFNTIGIGFFTDYYDFDSDNGRANMYYSSLSLSLIHI